jgi:hypothetical protein
VRSLIWFSYWSLIRADVALLLGGVDGIRRLIKSGRQQDLSRVHRAAPEEIVEAIDNACIFYPRRVMCLQRSAATVRILRTEGFEADLIIGVQLMPFESHAWVEVDGRVLNDKPYVRDMFKRLARY